MTNAITPLHGTDHVRAAVIDEVRAAMGRRRVSASALGRITGDSQAYWSRRLTGLTPFDVDDLSKLSNVLQVPITSFFVSVSPTPPVPAGMQKVPTQTGEDQYAVPPEGFEPPTSGTGNQRSIP